jgi:hypothetical protein
MHNCEKQRMISHPPRRENAADEELLFFQSLLRLLSIAAKPTSTLAAAYVHLNPCHKITTKAQQKDKETTKAHKNLPGNKRAPQFCFVPNRNNYCPLSLRRRSAMSQRILATRWSVLACPTAASRNPRAKMSARTLVWKGFHESSTNVKTSNTNTILTF